MCTRPWIIAPHAVAVSPTLDSPVGSSEFTDRSTLDWQRARRRHGRAGLTLTELLVVVSIVILLAGILVPLMQPILQGQNTREAARQLNVFLSGAQARAVALGRPVGVWIERATHDPTALPEKWYTAYKLYLAEQPLPYTGDLDNSAVYMFSQNPGNPSVWSVIFLPRCCDGAGYQVRPGDLIQFEYRGPLYPIISKLDEVVSGDGEHTFRVTFEVPGYVSMTPAQRLTLSPEKYLALNVPVPTLVPFTIYRQPVKTAAAPIELPNSVGLDLSVSGYAHYGETIVAANSLTSFRRLLSPQNLNENGYRRLLSPEHDIAIMFSPQGGVDNVYYISHEQLGTFAEKPLGNVSLLMVRDDKIGKDINGQPNIVVPPVSPQVFEDATQFLTFQRQFYQDNIAGPMGEGSLADTTGIWVTISGHSGRVFSAPNRGLAMGANISAQRLDARPFVADARLLADQGQNIGGR